MGIYTLQTTIDEVQLLGLLEQLPAQEKIKIANLLRARAAKEQWSTLSKQLPDVPEITMEEIVEEVIEDVKIVSLAEFEGRLS